MTIHDLWHQVWPAFVGLAVVLLLAATWPVISRDRESRKTLADLSQHTARLLRASSLLGIVDAKIVEDQRYAISVSDWGPEFTGQNGTLHRYRWVVTRARDPYVDLIQRRREVDGLATHDLTLLPFQMVGNAPTPVAAHLAALAWIETQQHPLRSVVVNPVVIEPVVVEP